jgi:hypothetical protein
VKLDGAVLAAPRLLVTPLSGATPSLRPKELKIAYPLSQECKSKTNIATSKTRSTLKWIGGYSDTVGVASPAVFKLRLITSIHADSDAVIKTR